jgi:hypothetical protein
MNEWFCLFFAVVVFGSGKVECALFGDYVDELKKKMGKSACGLPIVVVQFAKIKIFRGGCRLNLFFFVFYVDVKFILG